MRAIIATTLIPLLLVTPVLAEQSYEFRASNAFRELTPADQKKLERVHRDFVLLWGALDMYAEAHQGQVPPKLSDLVPHYLKKLPRDPFATDETSQEQDLKNYTPSCDGRGYRYWPGDGNAFVLCSVGLADFPYLAEQGNIGLYIAKGFWTGGGQLVR